MIKELQECLARGEDSRVIWVSSITGVPETFSYDDYQCLKGANPYESSKRVQDILSITMAPEFEKQGTKVVVAEPGMIASNFIYPYLTVYTMWIIIFVLRLIFVPSANITTENGVVSVFHAITQPSATLDSTRKYLSQTTLFGRPYVVSRKIEEIDEKAFEALYDKVEKLRVEFRRKYAR
ncbi:hypothetical protein HK102_005229 [Quaeritorhiza haematococci]|nr:hypothetical protein HK102_005229 [Quaeritorhiza haematococci]